MWEATHKPLPCFIWTAAFSTVTQWMTAPTATVCFPLKSNNVRPGQTVPTSRWHARMSPSQAFLTLPPTLSFELPYPCGCAHPLSLHCCATAFLPDQFLTQMSTDEAEENRARGWNMSPIRNRKTSGEVGNVSWLLLRGNGNTGGLHAPTCVCGVSPWALAVRAENKRVKAEKEGSASLRSRVKPEKLKQCSAWSEEVKLLKG